MFLQLKAATYNIRHAYGIDGKVDLDRIAQVIALLNSDIIGLQEVDEGWNRSGSLDQAFCLASALGMEYVFAAAFSKGESRFGNAILSRYPILYWDSFKMSSNREHRVLMRARIDVNGTVVEFYNTHLGLSVPERLTHIRSIILPNLDNVWPHILVGDLNCQPDSMEVGLLKTALDDSCPEQGFYTYPSGQPAERIDYILTSREFTSAQFQVVSSPASDHCPLAAALNMGQAFVTMV